MDASEGDKVELKVNFLKYVKMSIAIGSEFSSEGKLGEYLFTENVNENGGFLRFPYPYQAFFTITYRPDDVKIKVPDIKTVL